MLSTGFSTDQKVMLHGLLAGAEASALLRLQADFGVQPEATELRQIRVMLQMTDGVSRQPFNLSEALAIEARARVGNTWGCQIRLGDDSAAALAGAVLLAAAEDDASLWPRLQDALAAMQRTRDAARSAQDKAVRATEIRFESGEVEAYDSTDYSTDR